MKSIRNKTSSFVGILFLTAMAASLIGGSMINSILSSSNDVISLSEDKIQLLIGVILELINAIAVIGIAVLMFPVFKKHNESMAIGYLGIRVVESIFCCMAVISPLSLINLSQEYSKTGISDTAFLQASGALSIAERSAIYDMLIPVFFGLGALLFYGLLYKLRLLPRFISIWGIVAAILILAMNLLLQIQGDRLNVIIAAGMAMPIILNEIFLGIWLIIKGFDSRT